MSSRGAISGLFTQKFGWKCNLFVSFLHVWDSGNYWADFGGGIKLPPQGPGPRAPWAQGPMGPGSYGPRVLWAQGPMGPRPQGPMGPQGPTHGTPCPSPRGEEGIKFIPRDPRGSPGIPRDPPGPPGTPGKPGDPWGIDLYPLFAGGPFFK